MKRNFRKHIAGILVAALFISGSSGALPAGKADSILPTRVEAAGMATGVADGNAIVAMARQYVGVLSYVYGGTDLSRGVDCSGFVYAIYAAAGVPLPYRGGYDMAAHASEIGENIGTDIAKARAGDIVIFGGGSHVGIASGNGTVIQAENSTTGVRERNNSYMLKYFAGITSIIHPYALKDSNAAEAAKEKKDEKKAEERETWTAYLSRSELTLDQGGGTTLQLNIRSNKTGKMTATTDPGLVTKDGSVKLIDADHVRWFSTDSKYVTTDARGRVTAVQAGSATVSCEVLTDTEAAELSGNRKTTGQNSSESGNASGDKKNDELNYSAIGNLVAGCNISVRSQYRKEWRDGVWYSADGSQTWPYQGKWYLGSRGWWYGDNSGWYARNEWQKINGNWYFFDRSGYIMTGWVKVSGIYYYMISSGEMVSNAWVGGWWVSADGSWTYPYYGQWHHDSRGWWYGDSSGWYAKDVVELIDGVAYRFNAEGYLIE